MFRRELTVQRDCPPSSGEAIHRYPRSGGSNARLMKVLCVRAALDSRKTDRADRNGRFHFPESNNNIRSLSFHRRQRTYHNIKERSPRHRAEPGYKNLQTCTGCLSAAGSVNVPRHSATGAGWTRSAPAPEATSAGGKKRRLLMGNVFHFFSQIFHRSSIVSSAWNVKS